MQMQSTNKELAFELQNVIGQLARAKTLKHDHSKIKGAEGHILLLVAEFNEGKPVTTSEIANRIGVTLSAVTHQTNTLEKQGLIRRLSDSDDRRIILIELTKSGKAQVLKLKREFARKAEVLAKFLGVKDTKDLIRIVKKMAEFKGFS